MSECIDNAAREYGRILRSRIGPHLQDVILFGSRARGNADDKADYDILVVVDRCTDQIRETVLDIGVEMMNRYEILFAPLVYDKAQWEYAQDFPLAWNIQEEGVAL